MRAFPNEFSGLLTPHGGQILGGQARVKRMLPGASSKFTFFPNIVDQAKARACVAALDAQLYQFLSTESRGIERESISGMTRNYTEVLNKTIRMRTAFLRRRSARSYQAAERIGLIGMMRSESFVRFAEMASGLKLRRSWDIQVTCYGHGDYAGPHNDHHPESEALKDGFIDVHVTLVNNAVAHQYLVYERRGHFSEMVDVNSQGSVSVYRLPFWHYTTPLIGKPGREREARRWLLLGTFEIVGA